LDEIRETVENDEHIFELIVKHSVVCSAKTLGYEILESISTIEYERRKHYATKLLLHIEELARQNETTIMKTTDIDSKDTVVVLFFTKMGYTLQPIGTNDQFLEGVKNLRNTKRCNSRSPNLDVLSYLFEFRDCNVREKYFRVSQEYSERMRSVC
jgi:hypothetical protein